MSTQVGRISGALLKDNLLRDGVDLAFENDLIYIDVNNQKIGIKSSAPLTDLFIDNFGRTTNIIIDNRVNAANIEIQNNNISSIIGPIYFNADNVSVSRLGVGTIQIDDNDIFTMDSNADLELRPNGFGKLKLDNNLWIDGNLHSTNNITADGTITFGTDFNDDVTLLADVNSDIIPNIDNAYVLGNFSRTLRWNNTYAGLLNGSILTIEESVIIGAVGGGINFPQRQGKIWYVATYGSSEYVGDHQNGPFESIERAINNAQYGDTIFVYPGTYYELLPLTVPAGVTITGTDLRNTIVQPDTASEFEDVFLLNDASTVQNLTIKNFYFDSINNKGYAFKFAPGIKVVHRSPYIQNVSVITQGSVTSGSDPRGFDAGDAGKGAYIDGSVADSQTNEAAMLFHSATFITPGVDTITMINGVRVEWLDSFTYFANRGLYALQGTGRTKQDGSTIAYGAEVRSINSASIYGNYGAEADGADTLMYLINHNFAYIGTGKNQENDITLVTQADEVIEINGGQIHYTSFDQRGTFRVGDIFFVDLENGTTSLDISTLSTSSISGLNFIDNDNITYIEPTRVETGNIRISGNIIQSLIGEVNISAANNNINLNTNIDIPQNLSISNDFTINGTLTLGNQITDVVAFNADVDDNLDPKANNTYNIGSPTRNWKDLYTRKAYISDVEIFTNYITTNISNADLELRTSGTGTVLVENIRVQQRTVSTDSANIRIEPATTLDITGNTTLNGNLYVTQDFILDSDTTFGTNTLNTVTFNASVHSDIIPQFNETWSLGDSVRSWNFYTGNILLDDIEINDNYIRTTATNLNLELKASGVGSIQTEQTYFNENLIYTVGNNLRIEPATTLDITASTTNINGELQVTDNVFFDSNITIGNAFTDNVVIWASVNSNIEPQLTSVYDLGDSIRSWNLYAGKILLDEIEINDNYIYTKTTNLNLELKANGTGSVIFEKTKFNENLIYTTGTNLRIEPATTLDITGNTTLNGNFRLTQNTTLDSDITLGLTSSSTVRFFADTDTDIIPQYNDTYSLGSSVRGWNLYVGNILLDDIEINDNYIRTTASNLNLELKANGTGAVRLEKVDINENTILTNGTTNLILDPATTLDILGTTNVTGSVSITGDFDWQGSITFGNATTDDVVFLADIDSDLIPDINITYNIGSLAKRWKTIWTENAYVSDIEINTNYIRSTSGNLDVILQGNSAGGVRTEDLRFRNNTIEGVISNQDIQVSLIGTSILDINTTTALKTATGTTANRPIASMNFGDVRFNTTDNLFGGYTSARVTFGGVYSADRLTYARVEPTSNIITFSSQGTTAAYVDTSKVWLNGLTLDSFTLQNNTWSTNNINFLIDPDANNVINIEGFKFDDNEITNNVINQSLTIAHTNKGYLEIKGSLGFIMPAGTDAERPGTPEEGTARWNTDQDYLEMYINGAWGLATASAGGFASLSQIDEINTIYTLILG